MHVDFQSFGRHSTMIDGLERLDLGAQPPGRDTWLGYHRDLRRLGRLRALVDLVLERLAA